MSLLSTYVSDALNGTWRINVSGQVYGPYTGHQIKAFATEGRIAPHSIVQSGSGPWITAIDDPVLSQLFVRQQKQAQENTPPAARPYSALKLLVSTLNSCTTSGLALTTG